MQGGRLSNPKEVGANGVVEAGQAFRHEAGPLPVPEMARLVHFPLPPAKVWT